MHKKLSTAVLFLAAALLLTASPAVAATAGAPGESIAYLSAEEHEPRMGSWLQDLLVWFGEAILGSGDDSPTASMMASSETDEGSGGSEEEPSSSEPGIGVIPTLGVVGDPDG